ncbi:MAG: co-chaperone DjlA [Pseudomonadota bacterium]
MSWWGKVLGGTLGFMLGGPLGAMLGAAWGHNYDERSGGMGGGPRLGSADHVESVQSAFFTATFTMMGYLSKADGLVTREEIAVAESVMQQMRLNPQQRQIATALFAQGKADGFPFEAALQQLRTASHRSGHLLQMFLEILTATALADGNLHAAEQRVLEQSAHILGFSNAEFQSILRRLQASQHMHSGPHTSAIKLTDAYRLLGVDKSASDDEIKKAYRRLMAQHHPDKLVAKGLPQEMMDMATKKTGEIKEAYELIRRSRA